MTQTQAATVSSYNEWDPLEEVIVGRLEGAVIPGNHIGVSISVPRLVRPLYALASGRPYPSFMVKPAQAELEGFIRLLEAEGVRVRRPDILPCRRLFKTPFWQSRSFCTACPRDGFLVVGDEIIESAMGWRCRQYEWMAYRTLFKEYFHAGARWSSAPRPELADALFDYKFSVPRAGEELRYVINEYEPVWDAADFVRCGQDLFVTRSNVTNEAGIRWLERHLGDNYRIHRLQSQCRMPMHIDSSFIPLAPGKVMINPDFIDPQTLPPILKKWDVLIAPRPDPVKRSIFSLCSAWLSMNVLSLSEKRVVVEASQKSTIRALKEWGFEPLDIPFNHYGPFGGAFHCATLDIRRRGNRQNYFS